MDFRARTDGDKHIRPERGTIRINPFRMAIFHEISRFLRIFNFLIDFWYSSGYLAKRDRGFVPNRRRDSGMSRGLPFFKGSFLIPIRSLALVCHGVVWAL